MRYPLGSFPRFGYQARNASIRRELASANSAATRRAKAMYEFRIEGALFSYIELLLAHSRGNCAEGVTFLKEMNERASRIRRKHGSGERVYFKYLGETLRLLTVKCGIHFRLKELDDYQLMQMARLIGLDILANPGTWLTPVLKEPANSSH